ncbi:hypothetical protein SNEBB_008735 [Seison nebaliae]|nr:hypothetical protein SNEBB_008735 [Seison nebaliae]
MKSMWTQSIRNYAKRMRSPKFVDYKSGDKVGLPIVESETIMKISQNSQPNIFEEKLKKLFSLEYHRKNELYNWQENMLVSLVSPNLNDENDVGVQIAKLTGRIRKEIVHHQELNEDGWASAVCRNNVMRRNDLLSELRRLDKDRYEYIKSILKIDHYIPGEYSRFKMTVHGRRRWELKQLAHNYRMYKLERLKEESKGKQEEFEKYKKKKLKEINNRLKLIGLESSTNAKKRFEKEIKKCPEKLYVHDSQYRTCAHVAANKGSIDVLEVITKLDGKMLNMLDNNGNTPLFSAVENDEVEIVQFLLGQHVIELRHLNNDGLRIVTYAVVNHKMNSLECLLKSSRIRVDEVDKWGDSALHYAARNNWRTSANILLESGADMFLLSKHGKTPFHLAAMYVSNDVLEEFFRVAELKGFSRDEVMEFTCNESSQPLHSAVNSGSIEAVNLCLSHNSRITNTLDDKCTPVHLASMLGSYDILDLLLRNSTEDTSTVMEMVDLQEQTPLHKAAMFGHLNVCQLLLLNNAAIDAKDIKGRTPLLLAARKGAYSVVQHLLDHPDGKLNGFDYLGRNILHLLIQNNAQDFERIQSLINSRPSLLKLLKLTDNNGNTPLHYACEIGCVGMVDVLIKLDDDISPKNKNLKSPLHLAAEFGKYNVCELLLKNSGGKRNMVNEIDKNGFTPLLYACKNGKNKLIDLLLEMGGILLKDFEGNTAIHHAASGGHYTTITKLLKTHIHLINSENVVKNTALHLATLNNKPNIIICLMSYKEIRYSRNANNQLFIDLAIELSLEDCCNVVIKHNSWKTILTMDSLKYRTPFIGMIERLPKCALNALDRCYQSSNQLPYHPDFKLTVNFCLLRWTADQAESLKRMIKEIEEKRKNEKLEKSDKEKRLRKSSSFSGMIPNKLTHKSYSILQIPTFMNLAENSSRLSPSSMVNKKSVIDGLLEKTENNLYSFDMSFMDVVYNPFVPISTMVKYERIELLSHPVTTLFLDYKWRRHCGIVQFLNLAFFAFFLFLFTLFIWQYDICYHEDVNFLDELVKKIRGEEIMIYNETAQSYFERKNFSIFSNTSQKNRCTDLHMHPQEVISYEIRLFISKDSSLKFKAICLFVYSLLRVFELIFLLILEKYRYFQIDRIMQWFVYLPCLLFSLPFCYDISSHTQWVMGTISIFFAWFNLLLFVQRLDIGGIYVVMYFEILKTLLKVAIIFSILMIGFAFSFIIIYSYQIDSPFHQPLNGIIEILFMMMGDTRNFELFSASHDHDNSNDLHFPSISHIFIVTFLLLMCLLLMNLLIGLAVGDIGSVRQNAELKRLTLRVLLHCELERKIPKHYHHHLEVPAIRIFVNREHSLFRTLKEFVRQSTDYKDGRISSLWNVENFYITKTYRDRLMQSFFKQHNRDIHEKAVDVLSPNKLLTHFSSIEDNIDKNTNNICQINQKLDSLMDIIQNRLMRECSIDYASYTSSTEKSNKTKL